MVVEAVRGNGAALVQEGVTPGRWISKWGAWTSTPDGSGSHRGIDLDLIDQVVRQTKAIARAFGRPVDLEWVVYDRGLQWVQLREITALDIPLYSNRIAREVFPGIIKPLIWSVNVPLVNGAWVKLLTEVVGPNDLEKDKLAARHYGRAYFDMGALGQVFELLGLPRESLELLIGIEAEGPERPGFEPSAATLARLPRMLGFALKKARFSRQVEAFLTANQARWQEFRRRPRGPARR